MTDQLIITEKELFEIELALNYKHRWHHGSPGHSRLMLIASLAEFIGFRMKNLGSVSVPDSVDIDWSESVAPETETEKK